MPRASTFGQPLPHPSCRGRESPGSSCVRLSAILALPSPICSHHTPRSLDAASADAYVDYHRCDQCGAVWNVAKSDPHEEANIVVPGKPSQR